MHTCPSWLYFGHKFVTRIDINAYYIFTDLHYNISSMWLYIYTIYLMCVYSHIYMHIPHTHKSSYPVTGRSIESKYQIYDNVCTLRENMSYAFRTCLGVPGMFWTSFPRFSFFGLKKCIWRDRMTHRMGLWWCDSIWWDMRAECQHWNIWYCNFTLMYIWLCSLRVCIIRKLGVCVYMNVEYTSTNLLNNIYNMI